MSAVLNMVSYGGGKIKNTDALLAVYVLTGSTISITKNGISITPTIWTENASNTIDCALFVIPSSTFDNNQWSISASVSGKSASSTIVIDSAKEYEVNLVQELSRLYLLKGNPIDDCTSVHGRTWTAVDTRQYSADGIIRYAPSINRTGTYLVASNGATWTSGTTYRSGAIQIGGSAGAITNDLSGYTKITMEYDMKIEGSPGTYRKFSVTMFASKTTVWESEYQNWATNYQVVQQYTSGGTWTGLKSSLGISGGGYVQVGIGLNQNTNPGSQGTITIKAIYAEP